MLRARIPQACRGEIQSACRGTLKRISCSHNFYPAHPAWRSLRLAVSVVVEKSMFDLLLGSRGKPRVFFMQGKRSGFVQEAGGLPPADALWLLNRLP
jgi:hypothetical protein